MDTKVLTFKGGIHPPQYKDRTKNMPIEIATDPKLVIIPLQQHLGKPCEALVEIGKEVKVGEKIGQSKDDFSFPIHSSVSGIVKKIENHEIPTREKVSCITIESDGQFKHHESIKSKGNVDELTNEEILSLVKECGLTGMGGAGFPTHIKLNSPSDKKIDILLINGAECEPYLTADHRIMLEKSDDVVTGIKAMMKCVGAKKCYLAIENNKEDAIENMREALSDIENVEVVSLQAKYPQGDEKRIINAVTGRIVPSGGLPMDVGCIVNNVGTVATLGNFIKTGMPAIQRVVTVTGSAIKNPKNLYIRIGTLFTDIIDQCGGYIEEPGKIISGGPMMGISQNTSDVPVIKGTSGILVISKKDIINSEYSNCIRCGKCVSSCPVGLSPYLISRYALNKKYKDTEMLHVADCIQCGSCSFVCPAKRPLSESIKMAKTYVVAMKKKALGRK